MPSLLENLKAIRNGQRDETVGICCNLNFSHRYEFLVRASAWPTHSMRFTNPVPGNYYSNRIKGTLWQGEQLQLRLELLDFIIGELEK